VTDFQVTATTLVTDGVAVFYMTSLVLHSTNSAPAAKLPPSVDKTARIIML